MNSRLALNMPNLTYKAKARRIIRYLSRYKKRTTTPIIGRVKTVVEFRVVMKVIRNWLKDKGSYLGVLEQGDRKLHYHGVVWRMKHNKPTPLSKSEVSALMDVVHTTVNTFRDIAGDTDPENAMRLVFLRRHLEPALIKGEGNPFYEVVTKKKGVPLGWGGRAANYAMKTITRLHEEKGYVTSSGINACLRSIRKHQSSQDEEHSIPVLNGIAGPFNLKTVSILVHAVCTDLDEGKDIHTIAHRWKWGRVLIRYDNLKLLKNEMVKLGIGTLYALLKTQKVDNGRALEPTDLNKVRLRDLRSQARRVLSRLGRWWMNRHDWTYQQFIEAGMEQRHLIKEKK